MLKRTLRNSFNRVDFRIVMTNPLTIGSFFKIKDPIPDSVRFGVVRAVLCDMWDLLVDILRHAGLNI